MVQEAMQLLDAQLLDAAAFDAELLKSGVPDAGLTLAELLDSDLLDADLLNTGLHDCDLHDVGLLDVPPVDVDPGARIDVRVARAQFAGREIARATARQLAAIRATVREAREFPDVFIGPGNGQESARAVRERVQFAERAAILELATSLGLSQNTIRNRLGDAELLASKLSAVWADFVEGEICYPNVRAILDAADGLPADDDTVWAVYDSTLAHPARTVNPARMRILARSLAEKLAAEPLAARHARAATDRRVWVEDAADGMAWLGALQPAEAAYRAYARVNANAKHLAGLPGETRTIGQIRADVLADLLTGQGTPHEVKATVMVTVPVLTLLNQDTPGRSQQPGESAQPGPSGRAQQPGQSDQPGQPHTGQPHSGQPHSGQPQSGQPQSGRLNGYGPIDPDTARRLAGKARSFHRILTDPVTSAILDVDRTSYKVPADLKRWILATHTYCSFPGCNRLAIDCDIDHSLDWGLGGITSLDNLAPVCRDQHRLKHHTRWAIIRHRDGTIQWESPRGRIHNTDPPPF